MIQNNFEIEVDNITTFLLQEATLVLKAGNFTTFCVLVNFV